MEAKVYSEYKSSEIAFLGDVPLHWDVMPIKFSLAIPITDGPHETPKLTNNGIPFISAEAIKSDRINFEKKRGYISEKDHERFSKKYKPLYGDIYMVKSGATTGNAARVETDEEFNIWSPLAALRPDNERAVTDFIFYYMKSKSFFYSVELNWNYGTQQNIGMGVIANLKIALPSISEQKKIGSYLNYKTAQIDRLIEKKKQLIEKLNEKRIAVITQAVTKGLDSTVPMKESGVDWLGEVPSDWEILKLKYVIKQLETGCSVNAIDTPAQEGETGVLKTSCVYTRSFRPQENKTVFKEEEGRVSCPVQKGAIIISRMNTPDLVGAHALVKQSYENLYLPDRLWQTKFSKSKLMNTEFLNFFMLIKGFRDQVANLAEGASQSMQSISKENFLSISFLLPPIEIQNKVVKELDKNDEQHLMLINKLNDAISGLYEYRTALITAAVTGKIDVRDIPIPDQEAMNSGH